VVSVVRELGGEVVAIGAIVKRGTPELALPVTALLDLPLKDYDPEDCPLCRQGAPLQDPGSRRAT